MYRRVRAAVLGHASTLATHVAGWHAAKTWPIDVEGLVRRVCTAVVDRDADLTGEWHRIGRHAARSGATATDVIALFAALRRLLQAVAMRAVSASERPAVAETIDIRVDQVLGAVISGHQGISKDDLPIAALLHEIRNPLTAINLSLQLVLRHVACGEIGAATRRLAPLSLEVRRIARMLRDAQEASSPTATEIGDHDLVAIVTGVVDLETVVALDQGLEVRLHAPVAPVVIECDRDRIHQVVLNLLRNAIEAATSRVYVEVTPVSRGATIVVRDDGPGFSEASLARLGSPFLTTKTEGTGLGLAVARHLMALHGGSLTARNTTPGAEVTASLPRHVG